MPLIQRTQKKRKYMTVSLGESIEERPYKCNKCGHTITEIRNEPIAMVDMKIRPNDAIPQKVVNVFCRSCDIVYLFV